MMKLSQSPLPPGIRTIMVVNCLATVLTLLFWLLVLWRVFLAPENPTALSMASRASTLGFLISDLIWAVPIMAVSIPGLARLRFWGWAAAQSANILWIYSMTILWVRDSYSGTITPGDILFLPLALFSLWSLYYLWMKRSWFPIG
jgi:hypothetical protein